MNFKKGIVLLISLTAACLGNMQTSAQAPSKGSSDLSKPPIAIPFTLKEAGYVTLVIEDAKGFRVRNLISETWFPAGANTAWWDGLNDLGRDVDAANHGAYRIPALFVNPGDYKVRGLVRGKITPKYEFSPYTTGNPPWSTPDHTGAWLSNHTPPMAAVFVPAHQSPAKQASVLLGCYVTEGPDGLGWVDLEGKKLGGKKWVGGHWTAAPYLARDAGKNVIAKHLAYVGSVWETGKRTEILELRITALTPGKDEPIIIHGLGPIGPTKDFAARSAEIGGLAVFDGVIVLSLPVKNQLLFINANKKEIIGTVPLAAPKGLAFDSTGRLFALSGKQLVRFNSTDDCLQKQSPKTLINRLEEPIAIALDDNGKLYISDLGNSHQVKIFSAQGKFLGSIGKSGVPKAGPYDPLHMNNPAGITIDAKQQLWVTENDFLPKRVSVWTLDGKLVKAFYGPGKYGGGGTLDPQDKTKFYYADEGHGAMEFKLDWEKGTSMLKQVLYRHHKGDLELGFRSAGPETPIYFKGKKYFTNSYNSSPTNGHSHSFLFIERNGLVYPVAAMGRATDIETLKAANFKSRWPEGVDLNAKSEKSKAFFIWNDLNEDAKMQPEEILFQKGPASGVTIMPDLSFCVAQLGGKSLQFMPMVISDKGIPKYDINKGKVLAEGVLPPASSGGNQVLTSSDGWSVVTLGIKPFSAYSLSGSKDGIARWSYPNLWPGLHASHKAPLPGQPGELIGPTRLLGGFVEAKGTDVGKLWAINGNHGNVYLFSNDGLFVATLFSPMRGGKRWAMPEAERGMSLDGYTLGEENFWPTITQTSDGNIYIIDGARSSIVHLDGLNSLRRLPDVKVSVKNTDLEKGRTHLLASEAERQKSVINKPLTIGMSGDVPTVDGKFNDWTEAEWVDIDKSGVKANFNAKTVPYDIRGAIKVSGDRLYVAYRTGDAGLLKNSGEMQVAPFKTGGALDLMIGANGAANVSRLEPVIGDARLLVTTVNGKPWALLYRAVVNGVSDKDKVAFSSPWRTITFDKVEDVTSKIQFAAADGNYEVSISLTELGLKPKNELTIKGDIGVLRGDGDLTNARIYWNNKASGMISDVPAEAMLTPALWGVFKFSEKGK